MIRVRRNSLERLADQTEETGDFAQLQRLIQEQKELEHLNIYLD